MTAPVRERRMSSVTASFLVVATMIGTGIFTTTGYLVRDIGSYAGVLLAWLIGGLTAMCGALAYAELIAAIPSNGGEYRLLTRVFNRPVGFMAAWASLVVGFAAPMAASSVAFESYAYAALGFEPLPKNVLAIALITALAVLHAVSVAGAERFQNWFTVGKILLVGSLVVAGGVAGDFGRIAHETSKPLGEALASPGFAVGLIFVSYAYRGWNTAAYIAGEVKTPERNLPRALLFGTGLVVLLYVGITAVFLSATDGATLVAAEERVGHAACAALFGEWAARGLSALIAVGLVSAVGALIATGPLIYASAGEDYPRLRVFTVRRAGGGPIYSIALQYGLAVIMILSAQYDAILIYSGFTLSILAALTVLGVFVLRRNEPNLARPYRTWGHPWTTLLFLLLSMWMVVYAIVDEPWSALVGVSTLAVGLVLYRWARPAEGISAGP
ncbi:MAG: amino acid permease [Polyangiales bacterium]